MALAVISSVSSNLPADLRLAQAVSEFAQALDGPTKQRFRELQVQLTAAAPSATDVIRLTEQLNREGVKRHASWQPAAGTRVGGFLRRLQQFAASGDVLIGGSQNLIASGVWASVRAMLEASIGYCNLFDQISTVLMKLTTSWYISQDFAQHFPASQELQLFLAEYLIRIVRLCHKVLLFTKRSAASLLATSLFSSFDAEFAPLQQELDQWGLLIKEKFNSLVAKSTLDGQATTSAKLGKSITRLVSNKSKQHIRLERQQRLLDRLAPDQERFESIWRRERKRGNATWIVNTTAYRTWRSSDSGLVLRVTGSLGSGKTVALANLVADISLGTGCCAFFFCNAEDKNTLSARTILGSIAQQLILGAAERCKWDELDRDSRITLGTLTLDSISRLLPRLLPSASDRFWIVVDGLDECSDEELDDLLRSLKDLQGGLRTSLCFSARTDSHASKAIDRFFASSTTLGVADADRDVEIHNYIRGEVGRRNAMRESPLSPETQALVVEQLILGAQGMYLWVALQLKSIFPTTSGALTTNEDVLQLLGQLPKSLPEAFDQALSRISDQRYGKRIFQLIAVAVTPLSGEQLKVALCVTPGDLRWDSRKMPSDSVQQLVASCGGSLVEVDEEDGHVRFIHHSVLSYLAATPNSSERPDQGWLYEAECYMGSVCLTYLHYPAFDDRILPQYDKVDIYQAAEKVKGVAVAPNPIMAHLMRHLMNDRRRNLEPDQFDVLWALQKAGTKQDSTSRCLLPYARDNWFHHTRQFNVRGSGEYELWEKVIEGKSDLVKPPWGETGLNAFGKLDLVITYDHGALYQQAVRKLDWSDLENFVPLLTLRLKDHTFRIRGFWLEDTISICFTRSFLSEEALRALLDLGARGEFDPSRRWMSRYIPSGGNWIWQAVSNLCQDPRLPRCIQECDILESALEFICSHGSLGTSRQFAALVQPIRLGWEEGASLIARRLLTNPQSFWKAAYKSLSPLVVATENGRTPVIRTLIANGMPVTAGCLRSGRHIAKEALSQVSSRLHQEICWSFSAGGAEEVTAASYPALWLSEDMLRLFDEWVEESKRVTIVWAIQRRYSAIVAQLPSTCFDITITSEPWVPVGQPIRSFNILQFALFRYSSATEGDQVRTASPGSPENKIIEILAGHAAAADRIDERDSFGWTALHYAAKSRVPRFVSLLLKAGADPNVASLGGLGVNFLTRFSPMSVSLDVAADLTMNEDSKLGFTALEALLACVADPNGKEDIAKIRLCIGLLGGAGADLSRVGSHGLTPLQYAIGMHGLGIVECLVRCGADVDGLGTPSAAKSDAVRDVEKKMEIVLLLECARDWRRRPPHMRGAWQPDTPMTTPECLRYLFNLDVKI